MRRNRNIRKDLRTIFVEGVAFSVMVGIGESYLPAFVLALGMSEVASGLVTTVPLVAGGLLQLITPLGIQMMGSHRRWAATCATVQASVFLPLAMGAILGRIPGFVVFAVATIYWASGMAIGPGWNVWVERLIPPNLRTRYFARRTSATNSGVLLGLLAGGIILEIASGNVRPAFAILFAVAASARLVSAGLLHRQTEPTLAFVHYRPRVAFDLMRRFPARPGGTLLVYMAVLMVTVTIASPFFTAFALRHLGMSYSQYMLLLVVALAAKVGALLVLGDIAHRMNLRWLLRGAWFGIAVVPALWLVSDSFWYLLGLQVFGGVAWAVHEYVTFLLLFEMIGAAERGVLLTAYNLANAVASAGGSLLGGFLFEMLGRGSMGYFVIFGLSSVARVSCLFFLSRIPGLRMPAVPVAFRFIGVRPATGAVIRPILASLRPLWGRKSNQRG